MGPRVFHQSSANLACRLTSAASTEGFDNTFSEKDVWIWRNDVINLFKINGFMVIMFRTAAVLNPLINIVEIEVQF